MGSSYGRSATVFVRWSLLERQVDVFQTLQTVDDKRWKILQTSCAQDRLTSDSVLIMDHRLSCTKLFTYSLFFPQYNFKDYEHIVFRLCRSAAMCLFWLFRLSYCHVVSVSFQTWNVQQNIHFNRFAQDFGYVLLSSFINHLIILKWYSLNLKLTLIFCL